MIPVRRFCGHIVLVTAVLLLIRKLFCLICDGGIGQVEGKIRSLSVGQSAFHGHVGKDVVCFIVAGGPA